ncbi:MAG: stage II sporulation protein P [Acetatifactor sp.]
MSGKMRRLVLPVLLLVMIAAMLGGNGDESTEKETTLTDRMILEFSRAFGEMVYDAYVPCISFVRQQERDIPWILQEQIDSLLPFYGYLEAGMQLDDGEEGISIREILLEEAEEGNTLTEEDLSAEKGDEKKASELDLTLAELLRTENEAAMEMLQSSCTDFVPHIQQEEIEVEALKDYEVLLKDFYTVDSNTMIGSDQLNVEKFLAKDMTVSKESPGPQILIFHTHSQEAFADSAPGDASTSIVGVGEHLAQILTDTYGYSVLHHTAGYDVEARDDAYSKALPGIEQVLADNPSIQVVIDLHRDEMAEETRLVMDLDGRPTARFMFFNGLSRTKKTGNIAYLYNENLEDNLAFSFQMQKKAYEYYPGLTRKIYLKGYRYNMHLMPKYLLIELGAQNNTVEEAMNACDPLAHILDMVLSGQ